MKNIIISISILINLTLAVLVIGLIKNRQSDSTEVKKSSIDVSWEMVEKLFNENPGNITDVSQAHSHAVGVRYTGTIWLVATEPVIDDIVKLAKPHKHIGIITE